MPRQAPPVLDHDTRLRNLQKANEVRFARAAIRKAMSDGKMTAEEVLHRTPSCVLTVPVGKFVMWVPHIGPTKAARKLRAAGVSPTVPIGHLSMYTRERLLEVL